MKVIYKYPFYIKDIVEVELPYNSKVLSIKYQDDGIYLWAMIDKDEKSKAKRRFYVFGTGNDLPYFAQELKHLTTVQDGSFVWHIFE